MKCPQCMSNQKYKEGMICNSCGYRFALNPKEKPRISDMAFKLVINKLSGPDGHYFTYHQLYAQVYRLLRKKQRLGLWGLIIFGFLGVFFVVWGSGMLTGILRAVFHIKFSWWIPGCIFVIVAVLIGLRIFRPGKIKHATIVKLINTYQSLHPLDHLVEGRYFQARGLTKIDPEIFNYAPERILIVERNDIADMLILNRFHFEHKTLVVSTNQYPRDAFTACQQFLLQYPELPIYLAHDASQAGLQMKDKLLADRSWNLEGKNVRDMGLFPEDLKRLKEPLWLPSKSAGLKEGEKIAVSKLPEENIRQGLRVPVDIPLPKRMMGTVATAMVIGAALLSEDLLAHRQTYAGDADVFFDGYG